MNPSFLPADEAERVRLLHGLRVLDTAAERGFDTIARMASAQTGCLVGALSFVDSERVWFKASVGLALTQTARRDAFCAQTILSPGLFVVHDALADRRFRTNPLVADLPPVRAYAGMPIVVDGRRIGAVCCMDLAPREFGPPCEAVLRDLAELAAALVQARSRAEGSQQRATELAEVAKSEFLSRMSHEMRTPLNAVIGFAQLLHKRAESDEVRNYAGHVLSAGEQLLAMTNDVLDLQRAADGHIVLEPADVALDVAVGQVIALLSPAADERGVRFDNQVGAGVAVRADEQRLRQVLLNIGSNAVKFNRPAGVVRWSVDGNGGAGRVRLDIEDTGSGLKPEQLQRLFQPFERLGRETSTIEGTGLGLIIARSLVVAMGGSLTVASTAGVGTRVVVELPQASQAELPFVPARSAAPVPLVNGAEPSAASTLRLLYVEDNRINAILFEEAIRLRDGIELRLAADGEEALDQVRDWRPDVLVLDAHLPGMDGFQLLDALRRQPGLDGVPAFMCSADAMPGDVERAEQAGFAGYWSKPINIAKIMRDLDRIGAGLAPEPDPPSSRG